ncbi:putative hydrocarbon binding protein [Cytobacillus eiseniae]|uniref:Hydrocarbon binding protein n=1 Tax=Cytobacillus eiseniae TaxID=762947 RepID=A0ABS4RCP3_9BACI|nr:YslB family protein [Cytobacillus eiseniae]MBP2240648.1 putative hydrocarbon binding protein [Cytobacillus eiseniae]
MSESASELISQEKTTEAVHIFGYELIREVLLQEILGSDAPEILYWAGKRLARKYPMATIEDVFEFFQKASWGSLSILKESKNEMELELFSPLIKLRYSENSQCTFQLEAGFIAQQIELQKEVICEAFEHPNKKKGKVRFTVKWDKKDSIHS